MFPLVYGEIYSPPDNYKQPDDASLSTNTEYPNLNSLDYIKRPSNKTLRIHNAYECIDLNDGQLSIATNKLVGREWNGTLWGFESLDLTEEDGTKLDMEKSCFKLHCNSLISCLQYSTKTILLVALHSGNLQVWSTRAEVRNCVNPYCMFMIGEKCEHLKPITCLDVMKKDNNKAITGGKDCTLKIWDMGKADLFSENTYNFAHFDIITDVDSSPQDASIFATCSLDKSALLWDDRQTRPAIAIYENHCVRFKTVAWSGASDGNHIYIGDESGKLHLIDIRNPNNIIQSSVIFDRPIRKIRPFGSKTAIIGDTNVVKAIDSEFNIIYENSKSQHFVRTVAWKDENNFLTSGFEGKIRTHLIDKSL